MFKLVVLSALLAAAAAKPGWVSPLLAPATYAATITAPATTSTYVQHSTSYVAPTVYSDIAYPHFIKKRSPQFYGAYAPYYSSYLSPSTYYNYPLAAPYYSSLYPGYAAPAHFIKKRSAPLLTSASYIAPALTSSYYAAAPLAATYSSAYLPSASYYSPFYSNYLPALPYIKK